MALPSSGPISMSMVATEFSSSQTTNMSLFGFGAALSTPVSTNIELASDFYGQSSFSGTAFNYNSEGEDTGNAACNLEAIEDTAYHAGSGTYPVANDRVYSNSTGTILLATGTYKYDNGNLSGGFMVIIEDNSGNPGLVQSTGNCGK